MGPARLHASSVLTPRLMFSLLTSRIEAQEMELRDWAFSMPEEGGDPAAAARAATLAADLTALDNATREIEKRNEQYRIMQDRTLQDRHAAERRMTAARTARDAATEDVHALTQHFHEMLAAKEAAERDLGAAVTQLDQVRADWQKKLRDRHKEVRQMERRMAAEAAEAAVREEEAAKQAQREEQQRAEARRKEQALEAEACAPEAVEGLQALELLWCQLESLSGGKTPEEVAACWQGKEIDL